MVKLSNTACWVSFILLDVQLINSSSDLRAPRSTIVTQGVMTKGSDHYQRTDLLSMSKMGISPDEICIRDKK
jgi:hypothetical protein